MKMRGLEWDQERVSAYTADLSAENLKLGKSHYEEMVAEVDIIIHVSTHYFPLLPCAEIERS